LFAPGHRLSWAILAAIFCSLAAKPQTVAITPAEIEVQKTSIKNAMFTLCADPKTLYWGPTPCKGATGFNWMNPLAPVEQPMPENSISECAVVTEYADATLDVNINQLSPATVKNGFQFRGQVMLSYTASRIARLTNGSLGPWSKYTDFQKPLVIVDLTKKNGRWLTWVGLLPNAEDFGALGRSRSFPSPPTVGGPSVDGVQRFREKFLTCSNGALIGVRQPTTQSSPPLVPPSAKTHIVPRQMNEDTFSFLDQIPLEKRQFAGSVEAFAAQLRDFITDQNLLPPPLSKRALLLKRSQAMAFVLITTCPSSAQARPRVSRDQTGCASAAGGDC
jgi:hypothetical protein